MHGRIDDLGAAREGQQKEQQANVSEQDGSQTPQGGTRPPLGLGTKFTYGFGQAAEGLKNGAFGVFLFFYYNQVLALSGTLAGLAVGIALVFDAVTDPMAGSISDNWRSKLGRRHPFMFLAAAPLAIAFFLLFNPPAELGQIGLFIWL